MLYGACSQRYSVAVNYCSDTSRTKAEDIVKEINGATSGVKAIAVQANVSKEEDVKRLFAVTTKELGAVTALLNNAAVIDRNSLETFTELI